MYVCMYVCICVSAYVYVYVYMICICDLYVSMICMYVYMYVCMRACMYAHACISGHLSQGPWTIATIYIYIYISHIIICQILILSAFNV
jgi:hypothetical protein